MIRVEPFAREHLEGFRALFESASSSCFCRYWHFQGTKNEWLDRCAHRPDENFAEQAAALETDDMTARGLVALLDGDSEHGGAHDGAKRIAGWMKLAPRERIDKLTRLPVYRGLPSEPGAWVVGCFLVASRARRRGVARALLEAAETHVRAWGGRALEGFPRRSSEPLHDEEAWQGPEQLFIDLGYVAMHDFAAYPMYRKVLS